ncbi:MAG: hypothetical protein M1826_007501 [Phylliscum demangeonii]|nr:MAG: hypothetical protein M1826_007501 [Phylliscum demangeonii]
MRVVDFPLLLVAISIGSVTAVPVRLDHAQGSSTLYRRADGNDEGLGFRLGQSRVGEPLGKPPARAPDLVNPQPMRNRADGGDQGGSLAKAPSALADAPKRQGPFVQPKATEQKHLQTAQEEGNKCVDRRWETYLRRAAASRRQFPWTQEERDLQDRSAADDVSEMCAMIHQVPVTMIKHPHWLVVGRAQPAQVGSLEPQTARRAAVAQPNSMQMRLERTAVNAWQRLGHGLGPTWNALSRDTTRLRHGVAGDVPAIERQLGMARAAE